MQHDEQEKIHEQKKRTKFSIFQSIFIIQQITEIKSFNIAL